MMLPMSQRRAKSEQAYQDAKAKRTLVPLQSETVLHYLKYWKVIKNRFPYDSCYKLSHMLIPRRIVPNYSDLTSHEIDEMRDFIASSQCQSVYDQIIENTLKRRSNTVIYHLHLLTFVDSRKEFKL